MSYTSVLVSVDILYTEGLWSSLMLCGNNKSVYMMYTAWSRKGTDMFCGRYVYRFLHSWKDDLFVITDVCILHVNCKKYKIYMLLLFQGSLCSFAQESFATSLHYSGSFSDNSPFASQLLHWNHSEGLHRVNYSGEDFRSPDITALLQGKCTRFEVYVCS